MLTGSHVLGCPFFKEDRYMNPYKKINRLENRIQQLEHENQELQFRYRETIKQKEEYEYNNRLAIQYKTAYEQLLHELKQRDEEVQRLIHRLKFEINQNAKTYKKAFINIKEGLSH